MSNRKRKAKLRKITIFTRAYSPFVLGGDVNAPIITEVQVGRRIPLGKGFYGYRVTSPNGATVIVEATTGGVIGRKIKEVEDNIARCDDTKMMLRQLREAADLKSRGRMLTNDEFWSRYEKSNP